MVDLAQIFNKSTSRRDKFLARLLGLFSEEIVRIWTQDSSSPYGDLGRPTITQLDIDKRFTLDFTLGLKSSEQLGQPTKKFVAEMKCWTEFDGYKYLNLATDIQFANMNSDALNAFLMIPKHPENFIVKVSKKQITYDGIILIWSRAEPDIIETVKHVYGLHEILTLENIINDLNRWNNPDYKAFLKERSDWCSHLFTEFGKK